MSKSKKEPTQCEGSSQKNSCACHAKLDKHDPKRLDPCHCIPSFAEHAHKEKHKHSHEDKHKHSHEDKHKHSHEDKHRHKDKHCHCHGHTKSTIDADRHVVTIRALSGLSGDMLLAGFASLLAASKNSADMPVIADTLFDAYTAALSMPTLPKGSVRFVPRSVHGIGGVGVEVHVPHEHAHRTCADIERIIKDSALHEGAKKLAQKTFRLLAKAEGAVHGVPAEEVTFHEVGALDSIIDICLVCALVTDLAPAKIVCSPLPLADGMVHCAHGIIPTPAPAVLQMLDGVAVCAFAGQGETVTPTALALLKALDVEFGLWPDMIVRSSALVYGTKVFEGAPNGAIFVQGV